MPRFALTIEYDGTLYCGWQRQANGATVQGAIEQALARLVQAPVSIQGAGRTDAGVHAFGQVASVDLVRNWRPDVLRDALNDHLRPHPIAILATRRVRDDFDARFSALARHYLYRICNRRSPLALEADRAWLMRRRLDAGAMHEAAQLLVGQHDFSTFRDSQCQAASPIKTLSAFDVTRTGDWIEIRVSAPSFLHRQVRSMVGSLEQVGSGKWSAKDLRDALEACERTRCGTVAPAAGLYLVRVDYPDALWGTP